MARSLLTQRRTLVAVVALLLISSILPAAISTRIAHIPRAALTLVLSPFTAPLKALSDSLRPGESLPMGLGPPDQAQRQLAMAITVIEQLEQDLLAARQQINLLTQTDAIAMEGTIRVPARVTVYSGDRVNPTITIDRGTAKGIADGAPVVHGVNLVGLVENTYPTTADVRLITAAGTQFQVRIRPPKVQGVAREVNEMVVLSEDRTRFVIPKLTRATAIEVGDWAHLADASWPPEAQGWVIGKVTEIKDDPQNPLMFKKIVIRPMVPLASLSQVTVVVPVE